MLFSSLIAFCSFASVVLASPIPETGSNGLEKRQSFSGRATFYDVGLGACGEYNVESDFIVALNSPQFGGGYPGPNCFKSITISYGGKTAQARVMDQCPSCGYGDLDLSRSLFNYFSDPGAGVFQMSWSFNGGGAPAPAPAPTTQKPKTSSKPAWTPPPTSTWTPPPTSTWTPPTSTYTPPAESSSTPTPTSTTPSASAASTTSSGSASTTSPDAASASSSLDPFVVPVNATVSGTVVSVPLPTYALPMGNLVLLNQVVTNLGAIVVIGAQE